MENTESWHNWTSKSKREREAKQVAKDYEEALDFDTLKKVSADTTKFKELVESKITQNNMELHPKVLAFAEQMQTELDNNSHKGDWNEFREVYEILDEFEYHVAKLRIALRNPEEREKVKEYIADSANFLMILGNVGGLYDNSNRSTNL